MKNTLFIVMFILVSGVLALTQNSNSVEAIEREIRRLDIAAAEAVLRKDFDALDRLCAEEFTINSPRNDIVKGREALKDLLRSGVIDYASFTREIETISIYEKTVIVMGRETVVTNERADQPRQTPSAALYKHLDKTRRQMALNGAARQHHTAGELKLSSSSFNS